MHNPPVSLHVLIAPDKFKGTLTAPEAAKAIARGWRAVRPEDELTQLPISDGGDGFGSLIANPLKINKEQSKDAALALILILLLFGIYKGNILLFQVSIAVLILAMIYPLFFRYFASVWYIAAQLLGDVVSRIILTLIYLIVITPIGIFRRLFGDDTLKLKQFKNGTSSIMIIRNHVLSKNDLEKPY